ncbi:MAG: response regulator transcription factor [Planctomycetes bacterium]|nr:response regulator transcription factor [Planctomycetota bacterium]
MIKNKRNSVCPGGKTPCGCCCGNEVKPESSAAGQAAAGIRVLCVDDHEVLVEGLKAQFAIDGKISVVGWLPSAEHLLEETARLKPDVVLLDIEMPGPDAFETAERLRHMYPRVRIVFLSAHVRDGYIAATYKCGAQGYFSKGDDLKAIAAGIHEVARNTSEGHAGSHFVMGPKVQERCLTPRTTHPPHTHTPTPSSAQTSTHAPAHGAPHAPARPGEEEMPATPLTKLSERELEVLRMIGKGLTRMEIAAQLSRSAKTIDGHQDRILRKLGLESRGELMRFAIREGLAEA